MAPQVTFGHATASTPAAPNVAFGTPTAEREVNAVQQPQVRDNQLTFGQAVESARAEAPTLVIHELTGTEQRQVALGGRALPFLGSLKFTGEMRIENTPYVGYPRVNQTVLGGQEQDTEMNGYWHDRYVGDPDTPSATLRSVAPSTNDGDISLRSTQLRTCRDLCDLFDNIRKAGRLLRVTWLHISRLGRLNIFEQDWQNQHDVKWRMVFKWVGQDDLTADLPSPARTTVVGMAKALSTSYVDLRNATAFDDLDGLRPSVADQIDRGVGTLESTITEVANTVETRFVATTQAIDSVRRAVSLATLVRDQAQDVIDTLNGTVASAMLTISAANQASAAVDRSAGEPETLEDLAGIDPGTAIAAACQQFGAIRAARALKHAAARARFNAIRSSENDVLAIEVMRSGEDLRDVSQRWYGTPEDWDQIRAFNGLPSGSPPIGTIVFVPVVQP